MNYQQPTQYAMSHLSDPPHVHNTVTGKKSETGKSK